jgi:hypothetical protein
MPSWVNGIGQTLGDSLVTGRPLLTSLTTYFVSSATGDDTNNNGLDPDSPFATTAKVITTAAGAAVILVYLSGHTETFTATVTPVAGSIFVGAGSSGGLPTVKLKMNASNTTLFTCSAAGVQLRNVWIQANQVASNVARVKLTGINCLVKGCYFECAALDNAAGVEIGTGGGGSAVNNTTFISTAVLNTAKPTSGLLVSAALTDIDLDGCVFDEGTLGFTTSALNTSATITRMSGAISLLHGANASLGSATGFIMPGTVTGAGQISYAGGA